MLAGHGMPAEGFLRHRGLIALAIVGAVAEACLLTVFAPAARPIAPQITALPPLAIFHDLRWLFGYSRSWYGFELAYAGLVFAQAAISTVMMRLAWPHELARPTWAATFGRCVIFTVVASVLLAPVVTLLFGVSLLPFSWPFLAALPALLLILLPLAHGGLRGSWWRTSPPARSTSVPRHRSCACCRTWPGTSASPCCWCRTITASCSRSVAGSRSCTPGGSSRPALRTPCCAPPVTPIRRG